MNKKGVSASNVFIVMIVLVAFVIVSMFGTLITFAILDGFTGLSMYDATMAATVQHFRDVFYIFDYMTVAILILAIIGIAITSYRLASAPVFVVVTFFSAAFYGYVGYIFDHIFIRLVSHSAFTTIYAMYPRSILICSNLEWVALGLVFIGSIALYAKKERGQFMQGSLISESG